MSFFCIRRLLPAKKAWKIFSKKLQTNLHKLQRSKAIRKPKKNHIKLTNKQSFWSFPSCRQRRRGTHKVRSHYRLQTRTPPVYIDQLFVDSKPVLKTHIEESSTAASSNKKLLAYKKKIEVVPQEVSAVSVTREDMNKRKIHTTADDMWEALVLASPQMNGINERAEEFIAKFRSDMQKQERSTRHL